MKKRAKPTDQQRREFLRNSAATGASAVIAAAIPGLVGAETLESTAKPAKQDAGYQLTQHVIDYYKTCAR